MAPRESHDPLPGGTVTFLFSDLEGSTRYLHEVGDAQYAVTLAAHRQVMRRAFREHGGTEVDTQGDAFLAVFPSATGAVAAAIGALLAHVDREPSVRIGLHTGRPLATADGYVGIDLHRGARVGATAHGGQIVVSEATANATSGRLPSGVQLRDLGAHRLKDLAQPQRLFQVTAPGLGDTFPPLRTLDIRSHNLPVQPTSLVGRQAEMATAVRLLGAHPLVTLTGPGGTGKTRLSIQAGAEVLESYRDGVWFVDLAPLGDSGLVPSEVGATLGIGEDHDRPMIDSLVDGVRSKQLLLILDNCEHLVAACAGVAHALLTAAPGVKILATSREPLGVAGEATYRLPSLALPASEATAKPSMAELLRSEAVQLFIERAQAVRQDISFDAQTVAAVARICRRLDGIPLAIELAAARARALSIGEIETRLADRFRLLAGGSRTALPRQQTLRALIDWSYDLLDRDERALFARLSTFAGPWDMALAEEVCSDDADGAFDVLDVLLRLVDKSLVVAEPDEPQTRYRMLDTLRAYAEERLGADPADSERWRRRHLDAFVRLAEQGREATLTPSVRRLWLARAELHLDDFRASFATALQAESADAVRLAGALDNLWAHGHLSEGRETLRAALGAAPSASAGSRALALVAAARVAFNQSRYEAAVLDATEAFRLAQGLEDPRAAVTARTIRGLARCEQGDVMAAREDFILALDGARAIGDRSPQTALLNNLGLIELSEGRYRDAIRWYEESAVVAREAGDEATLGYLYNNIAVAAEALGELSAAEAAARLSVDLVQRTGDPTFVGYAQLTLAHIELALGDVIAARRSIADGLTVHEAQEVPRGIAYALEYTAMVAERDGAPQQVVRLLGAAAALRLQIGSPLRGDEQADVARLLERARASVGHDLGDALFAAAQTLELERAIAAAREVLGRP
jgi:predicted ATPase/class 3 adenylate cyclase